MHVVLELEKPSLRQYIPIHYQLNVETGSVFCLYCSTDSDVTVGGSSLSTLWPSKYFSAFFICFFFYCSKEILGTGILGL